MQSVVGRGAGITGAGGGRATSVAAGLAVLCWLPCTGCLDLLIDKAIAEAQGGRGMSQPIIPMERGTLQYHTNVSVEQVYASRDGGIIPAQTAVTVRTAIEQELVSSGLFVGGGGRHLVIKVMLLTRWPAIGLVDNALGPYSDMVGRVEFIDRDIATGAEKPLGSSLIRGYSTAIARKSDADLAGGFADAVVSILEDAKQAKRRPKK